MYRFWVGFALCALVLFAFTGCPDVPGTIGTPDGSSEETSDESPDGTPDGGDSSGIPDETTPDIAPPVIALKGDLVVMVAIGDTFTDPGFYATNTNPPYTGMVTTTITDSVGTIVTAIDAATAGEYTITYTASPDASGNTPVTLTRTVRVGVDIDANARIDIYTLDDLNAIRYNLAGTSYRASANGDEMRCGATGTIPCTGYELMRDLDFADGDSYASGEVNGNWRPTGLYPGSATNPGWEPIGTRGSAASFSGSFFGNGFTISNLYTRRTGRVGLFGVSSKTSTIVRIGVVNARIYGDFIGGLIGENNGTITASYATGSVTGGARGTNIGGLIGSNIGIVTAAYATGGVEGGAGKDFIGGLIGFNSGVVTASYATGDIDGGVGGDAVGGLVGSNALGIIVASYATGSVNGGVGTDNVGGLIGRASNTSIIIASYGFGTQMGGEEDGLTRSDDANDAMAVADACALTEENFSTMAPTPDSRQVATQWDFGTDMQRPIVRDNDVIVPGQTDRDCI